MKALNHSRQREAIYEFLMNSREHPTADAIFHGIQEQYPKISLGTVYRNLALLEETGRIQKIPSNDAKDHYDADTKEHPHFICNMCGAVIDLEADNPEWYRFFSWKDFEGEIESSQHLFFGKCKECSKNKNNS